MPGCQTDWQDSEWLAPRHQLTRLPTRIWDLVTKAKGQLHRRLVESGLRSRSTRPTGWAWAARLGARAQLPLLRDSLEERLDEQTRELVGAQYGLWLPIEAPTARPRERVERAGQGALRIAVPWKRAGAQATASRQAGRAR